MALWVLTGLAATMFLRTARELLIPVTMAVLISYALEPVVARLERVRIPRLLGAGLLLLLVMGGAAWGVYALRDEMKEATQAVPEATRRAGEWLGIEQSARQVEEVARSPAVVQQGVGWLLSAAGHLTVVVFLVYFLLISGEHFRQRFIEVAARHLERRRITIDVLDDINKQIQRFLLVRAVTSAIVGVATWAALAVVDVRQAAVWGVLAGVFNSIPYFGPVIA